MTRTQAERLAFYVLDAGLDARVVALERGDQFCLRIVQPQWHIWDWDDWTQFCKDAKAERARERKRAILGPSAQ